MTAVSTHNGTPLELILDLLADGQFHSGEELGALLGISRAAIWKHMKKIEDLGLDVYSHKGRGYCIQGGLELLEKDLIEQLAPCIKQRELEVNLFAEIDSTNSYLLKLAHCSKKICIAEFQSAGRGRRGRSWVSPYAQNIYLSIGWGFEGGISVIEGLSLAIGVAVVRALANQGVVGVRLKWPNDLLYEGKKLAGILVEMVGDPSGFCQVVVGVGINVKMMAAVAASAIDQPWIDLNTIASQKGVSLQSRNQLVAGLITELSALLSTYHQEGFAAYQAEWESLSAFTDKFVVLHNGVNTIRGVMRGVTSVGSLRLQTEEGDEIFHGGELSLRGVP